APAADAGFPSTSFSTVIESDAPIVASRAMTWDSSGYGRHAETGVASAGRTWYLAEGATSSAFHLYHLIQTAPDAAADVEITYLRPARAAPLIKTYTIAPHARRTILVNDEDPSLAATEVSAIVRSTNPIPIVVERALYLS